MRTGTHGGGATLLLVALVATLAIAGCGRKNLPVAPRNSASTIGGSVEENNPASLQNFQRSNRVTSGGGSDLRITPAEVSANPGQSKRRFLLDGLLN
ncbi:hypothetical protein [Aureimonas leprariae]|uniref:Lipoprotein n=1 Tax=Plantimonas leprariae TaxID=2615207 RepID=A0A7V7PLF4_9HYPH|nr:hypothetical protein [Aureimonas leprariae]KAB0677021.1 hypothetical protein F6X38_19345 [Aureimonas leprariae]